MTYDVIQFWRVVLLFICMVVVAVVSIAVAAVYC